MGVREQLVGRRETILSMHIVYKILCHGRTDAQICLYHNNTVSPPPTLSPHSFSPYLQDRCAFVCDAYYVKYLVSCRVI